MVELLTEKFFINSLVALLTISMVTGALGSMMIWQKLSYLGDSISHSSLLGIALALIFHINTSVSIIFIAIIFAVLLSFNIDKLYSIDTILNVITNITLALGLILLSFFPSANTNILNSLFGDVLMLSTMDLLMISGVSIFIMIVMTYRWRYWLVTSINTDLAISEKINVVLVRMEFLVVLAIFIAISSQLIGILLINAFLVIPAAAARLISKNPTQMVIVATVLSLISGASGLILSVCFDTLSGASIILTCFFCLICFYLFSRLKKQFI